jgi:rhodanese-related sulfurtransferase
MPLDVLAKLDVCEATVKDVRKVQETSIGAIYDLIHKVNHEVGKLAKELLDGRARSKTRPAAKKVAAPKKRSSRAPAAHVTRIQPRA